MRIIIKTLLIPIVIILSILITISKAFIYLAGGIMNILAFICLIAVAIGITNDLYSYMVLPALISCFLLSPLGIQFLSIIIVVNVELFRDWIKTI